LFELAADVDVHGKVRTPKEFSLLGVIMILPLTATPQKYLLDPVKLVAMVEKVPATVSMTPTSFCLYGIA
jgi:hypothetical protein